jgi:F-type H+-transporting ATPase subunit gamma
MKVLAAVSMRQYEQAVAALTEYDRTVEMALQVVLRDQSALMSQTEPWVDGGFGAVILGSEQGLCGRFNDQIAEAALPAMQRLEPEAKRRSVIAVGSRAATRLEEMGQPVVESLTMPASLGGVNAMVQDILKYVETWRMQQHLGHIVLFHNRLLSGSVYVPHTVRLLPFDGARFYHLMAQGWPSRSLPTFTMEREPLLTSLLRQHLFVMLYRSLVESLASENASRLASMQAAEHSIEERLEDLKTQFRYQRQHVITEELLDLVAGFEALRGA